MPKDFNEKNNRYNKYGNKNLDFSDWAFRPDLYGPVKTQKLTVFSAVTANDLRDVGYESYILNERYDTLGMRYMESLYTLKNLLVAKSAILHHKDGFATEILYTDLFDNLLNRLAYEYYPNGNWKRVTNYDTYYVPFEIIYYNYTDNGDISEIRKTDDGGNIISREIFLYDDNGNKIQSNVYDASGAEFSRTDFLYNIKNNLISYRTIENGDSLKVYYEADYQGDTLLLKDLKEITLLGEIISVTENEFDPLGNVLTQIGRAHV